MHATLIRAASAAGVAALTALASGQTVSVLAGGDSEFLTLSDGGSLEQAVVESRVGGTNTWELGLWRFGAVGTPLDQANRSIDAGGESSAFTLSYDGATTLTFTIDGAVVSSTEIGGTFTDIFIRVRSTNDSTSAVRDLQLNGSSLSIDSISSTGAIPAQYLRISNGLADFGAFNLTGTQDLLWTAGNPDDSALAAQFKLSNVIPAPGAAAAFGVLGVAASRRRR